MNSELFNRLKKLAKREGKVVFADDDDAFVILPLDEYEMLTDGLCGEECNDECDDENCDCHNHGYNFDFGEEIFMNDDGDDKTLKNEDGGKKDDGADKDLIRRVNEDIAKWREEQANQEIKALKNQESKKAGKKETEESLVDLSEVTSKPEAKEDVLTEEERYYLEPLE